MAPPQGFCSNHKGYRRPQDEDSVGLRGARCLSPGEDADGWEAPQAQQPDPRGDIIEPHRKAAAPKRRRPARRAPGNHPTMMLAAPVLADIASVTTTVATLALPQWDLMLNRSVQSVCNFSKHRLKRPQCWYSRPASTGACQDLGHAVSRQCQLGCANDMALALIEPAPENAPDCALASGSPGQQQCDNVPQMVAVTCGSMSGVFNLRLGSIAVLTALHDEVTPPCLHSSIMLQMYSRHLLNWAPACSSRVHAGGCGVTPDALVKEG